MISTAFRSGPVGPSSVQKIRFMKFSRIGGAVMGGRNAKPISLHIAEGNPNRLTKAQMEQRKESEIKLGDNHFKCPDYVKSDANAYKKWREIIKLYKDVDFVSSSDIGLLARYCLTWSEYLRLINNRKHIEALEADWDKYENVFPEEFAFQIEKLLKLNPLLQLETAINKKMDLLIKMEDRSFLNPLAKVKNVPKKEITKEDPLAAKGFGNI
jgi:phage terminase small subunit